MPNDENDVPDGPRTLPPGLDLLWGRRTKGQRGPKPGLSVDEIVEAAVELADANGLEAVSMANVAKRLGFTTMSLYRYVSSKDELLALMWNASAQGAESLELEGDTWRDRLRQWAVIQRQMLDQHAWITQMPMAAPPMAPNSLAFVECGLSAMDDVELLDSQKMLAIGLISSYTLSEARMAYDARRAAQAAVSGGGADAAGATPADCDPDASYSGLLRLLVDEKSYPRLHRMAWNTEPIAQPTDDWEGFESGLECILDGIAAMVLRGS